MPGLNPPDHRPGRYRPSCRARLDGPAGFRRLQDGAVNTEPDHDVAGVLHQISSLRCLNRARRSLPVLTAALAGQFVAGADGGAVRAVARCVDCSRAAAAQRASARSSGASSAGESSQLGSRLLRRRVEFEVQMVALELPVPPTSQWVALPHPSVEMRERSSPSCPLTAATLRAPPHGRTGTRL